MIALTKIAETSTKITLGWAPVPGATGYRFSAEKQAKPSHTWDPARSQAKFAKGSAWYKVEALGVQDSGIYTGTEPPPPPPPGTGTLLSKLSDFHTDWEAQCVNRWRVSPIGANPFTEEQETGTPWPGLSGPSIKEVSTPYGPGLQFISTPEQLVASGGKKTEIHDNLLTQGLGYTDEFSFKFMLPAAGNPDGFPRNFPSWTVLFDHHGKPDVPFQIGVSTTDVPYRNHVYGKSMGVQADAPAEVEYGHWYQSRHIIKWRSDNSGSCQWWLDGKLLIDRTGPTIQPNDDVNTQFGFYSDAQKRNEVWFADFRVGRSLGSLVRQALVMDAPSEEKKAELLAEAVAALAVAEPFAGPA